MTRAIKITIIVTLLLTVVREMAAQEKNQIHKTEVSVDFRWDWAVIDFDYMGTGKTLSNLRALIRGIGMANIDSLEVISYSSPEGRFDYNLNLSKRRAQAMMDCLAKTYDSLFPKISVRPDGESWHLFRVKAASDTTLDETTRHAVLEIVDSDLHPDIKKLRLKTIDSGRLYNYFVKTYFVDLRRSFIRVTWFERDPLITRAGLPCRISAIVPAGIALRDPGLRMTPILLPATNRKTIIALKTNLLYDLITALNFEIEIPIGNKFSIAVEDVFPWWSWGPHDRKYCFQMWEMGIEPRWWFRRTDEREVLTGQFFGVYGMSAKYDFQWNIKACYQGEYWSTGITYGCARKISRRFNLEFSASAGYISSDYRHYVPSDDYEHLYRDRYKAGQVNYFGLTKLKISLVCPINITRKKGGKTR